MRLAPLLLLPALALPTAADVVADAAGAYSWAAAVLGGNVERPRPGQDVHVLDGWRWSDCGLPTDAITIESITVKPDPPQPGANLTVIVEGTANEVVEEGAYADVTVKLGLIKLLQKRFDVCEEARKANASVQCPVKKGHYTVTQEVELPQEIPKAKFVVNVRGFTKDDDDLACLDLVVDFMKNTD